MKDCKARQYSDQMVCDQCGLVWDMNDPDPPACRKVTSPKVNYKFNQYKRAKSL